MAANGGVKIKSTPFVYIYNNTFEPCLLKRGFDDICKIFRHRSDCELRAGSPFFFSLLILCECFFFSFVLFCSFLVFSLYCMSKGLFSVAEMHHITVSRSLSPGSSNVQVNPYLGRLSQSLSRSTFTVPISVDFHSPYLGRLSQSLQTWDKTVYPFCYYYIFN